METIINVNEFTDLIGTLYYVIGTNLSYILGTVIGVLISGIFLYCYHFIQ